MRNLMFILALLSAGALPTPAFAVGHRCSATACFLAPDGVPPSTGESAQARRATLLFFSDAHAELEEHPEMFLSHGQAEVVPAGGYARMAAAVQAIRKETGGRTLLFDGGDTFQGSAAAAWSKGEAMVAPQRALGIDVGIPGNWEVIYGADQLRKLIGALNYPMLATNVLDARTGKPLLRLSIEREVGGVRLGIVGFTDPDVPDRQPPGYSQGLRYLGSESIAPAVASLRSRVDVVVLVTHVGLARSLQLAEAVPGVDVILSGDTHERVYEPILRHGVLVVEPGAFASFLGRLDVELRGGERPNFHWQLLELRRDRYPEEPAMRAVVAAALSPYRARMEKVLGRSEQMLDRYDVLQTSADDVLVAALREAAQADIALSNGFRFGHPIPAGPVTEADLWRLYPLTGRIKTGTVTGRQLHAFWESELEHVFATDPTHLFGGWLPRVSGMSLRFRAAAPPGQRIIELTVAGKPVEDEHRYRIATCEREGEPQDTLCRIHGAKEVRVLALSNHEAVRSYLARHRSVGAPAPRNISAIDLPERVFSQYYRR